MVELFFISKSLALKIHQPIIELQDGSIRQAEIHWYEAHGIGKRKLKIKAFLD